MSKKVLYITDMQNDFVDGSLANEEAMKIVEPICRLLDGSPNNAFPEGFKGDVVVSQDTHYPNYLDTQEGKNLPVEHTIFGSHGWKVNQKIEDAIEKYTESGNGVRYSVIKEQFGSLDTLHVLEQMELTGEPIEEVYMTGTILTICVLSAIVVIKAQYPEVKVVVLEDCVAALDEESRKAAMVVLNNLQVKVMKAFN